MGGKGDLSFPLRSYLCVRLLSRSNLVFCRGGEILGPSESRDPAQRRVKFADGVVDDWDVADFREKHIGGAILPELAGIEYETNACQLRSLTVLC